MELKKSLGQHFLVHEEILDKIVAEIRKQEPFETLIEIGPGMGALTQKLIDSKYQDYFLIEMDDRFVVELPKKFPYLQNRIFHTDVLKFDFAQIKSNRIMLVGNYPYNISTQIVFLILENCKKITDSVGMFQKEVAMRIASKHGSKDYGILSVLAQSIYEVDYLFDIPATAFDPPPKVVSGIISMKRRETPLAPYHNLKIVVKAAFNQRRKTLNNSLKGLQFKDTSYLETIKGLRPEQLSVDDFCRLSMDL